MEALSRLFHDDVNSLSIFWKFFKTNSFDHTKRRGDLGPQWLIFISLNKDSKIIKMIFIFPISSFCLPSQLR